MLNDIYSYIRKRYSLLDDLVFKKEENNSNIKSILLWIIMIILIVLDYLIANKFYLNYNSNINIGITVRIIKILPLFFVISYCYYFIMPNKINNIEMLYWMLFYILTLVPTLVVYVLNGIGDQKNILIFIYAFELISVACIYIVQRKDIKLPKVNLNERTFWILIIIFSVGAYGYIMYHLGAPSFKNPLTDLYGATGSRLTYRKLTNRYDDYFIQWLGNVINPFIFSYMLRKKKYKLTWIPIVLEMIVFMYSSYKSILIVFILAPMFGYIVSRGVRRSFIHISSILLLLFGVITGFMHKFSIYVELGHRIFIWPPLIAMEYYDFFYMYPKMQLAHSIFGKFISNKYLMEPSLYMGALYYGRPQMRLNTTWYADAYMNFGIVGIILFALLLIFVLLFIKAMEHKDVYLVSSLLFGGIIALFNTPLLTSILTSGLGMGLLIAFLLPNSICKKNNV